MLKQLDENLWVVDHPLRLLGAEFGTRTTIIRLRDGGLFLHSPGPLSAALRQSLRILGPVRYIVAPNKVHWFYVEENAAAYPDAQVYLAPGLAEKKKLKGIDLGEEPPEAWSADLDQVWVHGSDFLEEVVFFHPASRTVLLTDLAFNFQSAASGYSKLLFRAVGAWQRFGPSRIARRTMRDKAAIRAGIERILEWDFDRVTVTHGDVLESGGREALRKAFERV